MFRPTLTPILSAPCNFLFSRCVASTILSNSFSVALSNSSRVLEIFNQLREKKIQLCLDDFGTGYSSLSYLNRFPLNFLKIDRSFIKNLGIKDSKSAIVRAIIVMTRELEIEAIAEGIETSEQLNFLRALDCFGAQGYWFSHPLEPEKMTQFLKTYSGQI